MYNLQMMNSGSDIFKGKQVIRYDPAVHTYGQVLEALLNKDGHNIFSSLPGDETFETGVPEINTIGLSYPVLLSDKRWDTLHLTASSLFLGSALTNAGFAVMVKQQILPAAAVDSRLLACDLLGFTLFEDLFLPIRDLFSRLRNQYRYKGIVAAGGPLITLNPLQSAFHLPEVNLLVRGEAEFVLPGLIQAIAAKDINGLLEYSGFLFQVPGLIIISELSEIHRPDHFNKFCFNLEFLEKHHLESGLEINVSRGCKRGCAFCSAVQGRGLRKLPAAQLEDLLNRFSAKLVDFNIQSPRARTVNINDDDILQDLDYAGAIFQSLKKNRFRLWGIQTSIASFYHPGGEIRAKALEMVADRLLYVEDKPLVWIGTDVFLKQRGKRLGKWIPAEDRWIRLIEEFESREIRNYHYWISSDQLSDWQEFTREFILIYQLQSRFAYFGLIAHSPFVVPYATTPLYKRLIREPSAKDLIKYKKVLESRQSLFRFPLVERVETRYRNLNRLLNNEKLNDRLGFFDYLGQKDYVQAALTLYNFLKQERLEAVAGAESLVKTENELEEFIARII
jgi:hypothetical protein